MRVNEPNIKHYFDVWHVAKGSFDNPSQFIYSKLNNVAWMKRVSRHDQFTGRKKKLPAASKTVGCSTLEQRIQPTANHFYWCAATSRRNGDILVETWTTITRHVVNVHSGHTGRLSRCLYGPLNEDVPWLTPGEYHSNQVQLHVSRFLVLRTRRGGAQQSWIVALCVAQ